MDVWELTHLVCDRPGKLLDICGVALLTQEI
jgi:hypothetical protein